MNGDASMVGRGRLPDGGLGGFCRRRGNLFLEKVEFVLESLPMMLLLGILVIVDPL
jgi:hypothetical protein